MRRTSSTTVTAAIVATELAVLVFAEGRVPLQPLHESRWKRIERNGILATLAMATTGLVETPVAVRTAALMERRGWGLLPRLQLPAAGRSIVAIVMLDYGMYVWHRALHAVPFLWRFHLVHHIDRDLDVTTGLRIHVAEIALSVAFRVVQLALLGVTPRDYLLWQRLFAASVLFQHANVRLPDTVERIVGRIVVTPRRHRIHHLALREAQHGNWSVGLILWDWLHRTLRDSDDVSGDVGVPAYRNAADLTLSRTMALPFRLQPDPWVAR